MKIGKKISSNKIGRKMKRAAMIGGKGGIIYGRALADTGAAMSVLGGPEGMAVGVPAMAVGKGIETLGRMSKNAGQGKSVSKIERRATRDLTGGLF
tara:strand:- start:128 stop:415 length:288 start_codon:yes stop_codon:yes gene_type:complete